MRVVTSFALFEKIATKLCVLCEPSAFSAGESKNC